MDIAEIGKRHLRDALTRAMHYCNVTEWLDDEGQPVKIYWKPLTGKQQDQIDQVDTQVKRACMTVWLRALDKDGQRIFANTSLEGLQHDFDFDVIKSLAMIIIMDMTADGDGGKKPQDDDDLQDQVTKE